MFIVVEHIGIEQLRFNCPLCGEEQFCFTDMPIMTECFDCQKKLDPHPYHLYFSQIYRKRYHVKKENTNVRKEKE
jgi:hypothetical protein